jgi:transaldolase
MVPGAPLNLMIKIPATKEGLPAIAQATAEGINVNITLIFSLKRYDEVIDAYLHGLGQRLEAGQPVDRIHSVASFFVSRVDTKVDKRLEAIRVEGGQRAEKAAGLLGKAAVANARLAYQQFCRVFMGAPFQTLQRRGANLQRPLWASTSTKNPAYSDLLYVQNLIGKHTVNTLPQETMQAFIDHGEVRLTIEDDLLEAQTVMTELDELGISIDQVTQELEDEGVATFTKSFETLLGTVEQKRESALQSHGLRHRDV